MIDTVDIARTSLSRSEQLIISLMLCLSLFTLCLLASTRTRTMRRFADCFFLPFEEGFFPAVNVMCAKKAESCVQIYSSLVKAAKAFKMIGFARQISGTALLRLQWLRNFPIFEACSMTPHDSAKENDDRSWTSLFFWLY